MALNADICCSEPKVPCKLSVPVGKPGSLRTITLPPTKVALSASCLCDSSEVFWQGLGTPKPLINHPQHVMYIHELSVGDRLGIRPATKTMLAELIDSTSFNATRR